VITGWACYPGWGGSIDVKVFVGPAGSSTFLKAVLADTPNSQGVYDACDTQEGNHRFRIPLTLEEVDEHHGKRIRIRGISPVGNGNNLLAETVEHFVP